MKLRMLVLVIIFIGLGFWNLHGLTKISNLETQFKKLTETYESKQKELDRKIIQYNNKYDLKKIKKDMEKEGMAVSDKVILFKIGE